jgi:tetratricopeptide (TPR) repeat protein
VIDLNYLVATRVMDWEEYHSEGCKLWHDKKTGIPTNYSLEEWQPSESISQAFEGVVTEMRRRGYEFWLDNEESFSEVRNHAKKRSWRAEFRHIDIHAMDYGEKPPEAICKAALRALGWVDEENLFLESVIPRERYETKIALEAIRKDPDSHLGYYKLGLVYSKQRRFPKAHDAFKKAISIKPNFAEAYTELAWIYCQLKQFEEAVEEYHEAISINPTSAQAHYGLGLSYLYLGDYVAALVEYRILHNLNQELANQLFNSIYK